MTKLAAAQARRFVSAPGEQMGAALFYGPNRALSQEMAATLAKTLTGGSDDAYALTRIGDDELRKDKLRLSDALTARSLLGDARIVWVRGDGEAATEQALSALADIERGADLSFLIVETGDVGGKAKLVTAFEKAERAAAVACYEETDAERAAFLRGLIDAERIPLTPDARDAFLDRAPADRGLARGELEKIALYAHNLGRPVDLEDVLALSAYESEGLLDVASQAALMGKTGEALDMLDRLDGGNGVSVLKAMERRLLRLFEARCLVDKGVNPTEAGDRLKPKVFWKERDAFAAQLRRWTTPRLAQALEVVAAAEKRTKTAGAPQMEIAAAAYGRIAMMARAAG